MTENKKQWRSFNPLRPELFISLAEKQGHPYFFPPL